MSRTVNILGKKVSLIPLIAALIVGSVVVGYAVDDFLILITNPVQQNTYQRSETIQIGEIPEFIEATVTLEGEVNDQGEFGLNRPITVSLVINSLRPDFVVSDSYVLTMDGILVLEGSMVNVKPGTPHTDSGSWTPSTEGTAVVALDIINMVWTEINSVTFSAVSFVETEGKLSLVDHTLLLGEGYEEGTLVPFSFTVQNIHTENMNIFSYLVETSPDGSTWTNVASGSVVETIAPLATKTVDADFNAPSTDGTYEVRITISGIDVDTFMFFTSDSFTSTRHPDAVDFDPAIPEPLTLVSHTIPISTPIGSGTTVDFEYTVENMQLGDFTYTSRIHGWLWEVKYRVVGETGWTVATSGVEYPIDSIPTYIVTGDEWTVSGLSFTAPAPGDYELLINCWNVHHGNPEL